MRRGVQVQGYVAMNQDLLVEIGTEELPSEFIPRALDSFRSLLEEQLRSHRLSYSSSAVMGTPRRLALWIKELSPCQEDKTQEFFGPPRAVAFTAQGEPTKAAAAFAQKHGVDVKDLSIAKKEKGEYLCITKIEQGRETVVILQELLPKVILSVPFPKSMRWGTLDIRFARPIHWVLALYADKVVPFTIGDVRSGNTTRGHRFLGPKGPIEVSTCGQYERILSDAKVIVDPHTRKQMIVEQVEKIAEEIQGKVVEDNELLDTVAFLTEYPVAVRGRFDDRFIQLPEEVLISTLRGHQKYFAVRDRHQGGLVPYFITISNIECPRMEVIREGNERVIQARLEDARFFFEEDTKKHLETHLEALRHVIFHKELGTAFDKVQRIVTLAEYLSEQISVDRRGVVHRAALLCKADLVTHMVGEFPELQGKMGAIYARHSGEPPEVAKAIYEHYLPISAEGALPETVPGAVISIADKLDTLIGFFGIGTQVSGTADPFGLRRRAIGILRILLEKQIEVDVDDLLSKGLEVLQGRVPRDAEAVRAEVKEFLRVRLLNLLIGKGFPFDTVDAVLSLKVGSIPDVFRRIETLHAMRSDPSFERLLIGCKRAVNILRQAQREYGFKEEMVRVDTEIFREGKERDLHTSYSEMRGNIERLRRNGNYRGVLEELSKLKGPIDRFFDGVMVLVDERGLRENRLSLLWEVAGLFRGIADFSKISESPKSEGREKV